MKRFGHFLFPKCNCFPHIATSTSTVMEKFKLFHLASINAVHRACPTWIRSNYFHGNMTSQWMKQKSLEFVWEILWEAAMACVLRPFRREKVRADSFFYHSICFTIEYWITQEKVVRNTIKYFLSLFSIKSLVFEAAYLSRVRLFFFAYLVENDQKLNSDEANNFEKNINLTMINWVEEKMIRFRIWLSSIWLLNTTWD